MANCPAGSGALMSGAVAGVNAGHRRVPGMSDMAKAARTSGDATSARRVVDDAEVAKFDDLARDWWDPNGRMKPLHKFNPNRLAYIRDLCVREFSRDARALAPFSGLSLLDIGCGGGLLSEPLARMGFAVTGIDPAGNNVDIAKAHAAAAGVGVDYRKATAEELVAKKQRFDVVLAMEVVEHVPDVPAFMATAGTLVKPGGLLAAATINRTKRSFAMAIVGAEYILRWLPAGTHDWNKFVTPDELEAAIRGGCIDVFDRQGVVFNPLTGAWMMARDMAVNYVMAGRKPPAL
jgi:2-polyprenyl-6-hydroxyphenyl methylase / 3-demethylubiquinone-9 3-methyltransferase